MSDKQFFPDGDAVQLPIGLSACRKFMIAYMAAEIGAELKVRFCVPDADSKTVHIALSIGGKLLALSRAEAYELAEVCEIVSRDNPSSAAERAASTLILALRMGADKAEEIENAMGA